MKKMTFMLIAAFVAVISFAQVPYGQIGELKLAGNAQTELKAHPFTGKVMPTAKKYQVKAPAKSIKVTRNEILGSWMQAYYGYFDEIGLTSNVTISPDEEDEYGIIISGWWGSYAEDLKAKLNPSQGTITIDRQFIYQTSAELVNVEDTTAAVVGTFANGVITFEDAWGVKIVQSQDYYEIGLATRLVRPNAVMAFDDVSVPVFVEQDEETKAATVWNFGDFGAAVDVTLKEDRSFLIESQLVGSTSNGDFYTYSLTEAGGLGTPEITGTGTDNTLTFGSSWTAYASTGYWSGKKGPATITLNEGLTFEYPVIPEVPATPATPEVVDFWHYDATLGYAQVYVYVPTFDVDTVDIKTSLLSYQLFAVVDGEQSAIGEPIAYNDETVPVTGVYRIINLTDPAAKKYTRIGVKSIYTAAGETRESETAWYDIPQLVEVPEGLAVIELPIAGSRVVSQSASDYASTIKVAQDGNTVYIQGLLSNVPTGWVKGTIADGVLTIPVQAVGRHKSNGAFLYAVGFDGNAVTDITFAVNGYNWYTSTCYIMENVYTDKLGFYSYYLAGLTIGTAPAVADGTYYIYNKGAEKFLAAGADWGTHAVVNSVGLDYGVALVEDKYTFESQVSNGEGKHFLNGEWNDGLAFGWTVAKAGEYFTISNGEKFLTAGENGLVTLADDATADAAQWQFVAADSVLAARMATLAAATADNGVDASFFIKGADFNRNDLRNAAWVATKSGGNQTIAGPGGNRTTYGCESWNNTFEVSQTIENLPEGVYEFSISGYGTNGTTIIFANEAEQPFVNVESAASFGDALDAIAQGQFGGNTTGKVNVLSGTLKIGVKRTEQVGQDWAVFDKAVLTYYGAVPTEEYKTAYEAALKAAQEALANEDNSVITGEERDALARAIETYTNVEDNADAYKAATIALSNATATFTGAKAAYQGLADQKAFVAAYSFEYAAAEKKAAAEAAALATAQNAAEATAMTDALLKAYRQYAESSALLEGVEKAVVKTELIVNPAAEEAIAEPWTIVKGETSGGNLTVLSNEPWTDGEGNSAHKYFDGGDWGENAWDVALSQNIALPAGKYQLTVKSRAAAELASFVVFAGDQKAEMTKIGASGGLFNRGWNDASVIFELEKDTTIAIGVQGVTEVVHQWMSFSDFRLAQFPSETPGPQPEERNWIVFTEPAAAGELAPQYTNEAGDFILTYVDEAGKISIDANNAFFGDAEKQDKFTHRLKVGGKSSSKNNLTLTIPAAGVLKVYARSASGGATDRNVVFTQDGVELYNQVVQDADAIQVDLGGENPTKVYPVIAFDVAQGQVAVTYPVGALNFYGFEFIKGSSVGINAVKENNILNGGAIYNLNGQRVMKANKGLYIINGKKYVIK